MLFTGVFAENNGSPFRRGSKSDINLFSVDAASSQLTWKQKQDIPDRAVMMSFRSQD